MTSKLNEKDWQRIARFYADLGELRHADVAEQWRLVIELLEACIGGEAGFIVIQQRCAPTAETWNGFRPISFLCTVERTAKVEAFVQEWMVQEEANLLKDPYMERLMALAGSRTRAMGHRDILEPPAWDRAAVRKLLELLEADDRLTGVLPLSDELEISYSLDRPTGDRRFTPRDAQMLEACLLGLRPMSLSILAAQGLLPGQKALTPREHELISMLLGPMAIKEIAVELDLSTYYVQDLVKSIYRKMNVRSRPELMALWLQGFTS